MKACYYVVTVQRYGKGRLFADVYTFITFDAAKAFADERCRKDCFSDCDIVIINSVDCLSTLYVQTAKELPF